MTLVIVSHGSLSDSGRESARLRPKPGHLILQGHRPDGARYRSTAGAGHGARLDPWRGPPSNALACTPPGRTSTPAVPAIGSTVHLQRSSGKPSHRPSRSPREREPPDRTTGANDKRTSRSSILWAFCRLVVQHGKAAFLAWLQNAGGLCQTSHRANRRKTGRGSNRGWMKQVALARPFRAIYGVSNQFTSLGHSAK
jgi:hypothetical protein